MRHHLTTSALLALTIAAAPATVTLAQDSRPASPPTVRADLPAAKTIIGEAIAAMGGRPSFDKVKSTHSAMTIVMGPQEIKVETFTAGPDKVLAIQTVPAMNISFSMGRNGDVAWVDSPMSGLQEIPVDQLEQIREVTGLHTVLLDLDKRYGTLETVDQVEVDGAQCYKVRMADKKKLGPQEPKGDRFLLFDVKTKRPVAIESPSAQGGKTETALLKDWKKFGDLMLFTKIEASQMGMPQTMTYETIEFNNVDDAKFAIPEGLAKASAPTSQPTGSGGGS